MSNFSSQVVEEEGLADLIFEFSWDWHGFELSLLNAYLEGHGGSRFHIPKLEMPSRHVGIAVEESPKLVFELWEFCLVGVPLIVLAVVVQHVDCLLVEQLGDLCVVIHHLPEVGLLEVGVQGLISHPGVEKHRGQQGPRLEAESQMPELEEEQSREGQHILLEGVRQSVASLDVQSKQDIDPVLGLRQGPQQAVLEGSPEHWLGDGRVLRFMNSGLLVTILGVRVVSVLPFVLPPQVVWVSAVPYDLVESWQIGEAPIYRSCDYIHDYKYYSLPRSLVAHQFLSKSLFFKVFWKKIIRFMSLKQKD